MIDKPMHILLVEDSPGDTRLLQVMLAEADSLKLRMTHADRLSTGLRHLAEATIDVVLLDLSLPDSHGLDTLVRMHAAAKGVPIVVLTSVEDETLGVTLVQAGAQDYLVKGQVTTALLTRSLRYAAERKRPEVALRESEARYRSLVNTAGNVILVLSPDHTIMEWNREAEEIYGWPRQDVVGQDYFKLFLPESIWEAVATDIKEVMAGKETKCFENPIRTRDGSERILSWNVNRLLDTSRRPIGIIAIGQDITERKRAEEKLVLYREIFANSIDGIAIIDLYGCVLEQNSAHNQLLGFSDDELRGKTPAVHLGDDVFTAISRELARTGSYRGEVISRTKSGVTIDIELSAFVVRNKTGDPICYVGLKRDITQRKRAEEHLRTSEMRIRLLLESTDEGIYGIDVRGRCTFINKAAADMLGHRSEDVLEKNMHALIHHSRGDGSPYPGDECHIYQAFRSGKGSHRDDEVLWRRDGTAFPVEYSSYPIMEQDVVTGAVVTFTDITERKRAEEALHKGAERFLKQQSALIGLTQSKTLQSSHLASTLRQITEVTAQTLGVERVSIWRYSGDREAIECVDLYELSTNGHSTGVKLQAASYPAYFNALATTQIISADDAPRDPRTSQFSENYFSPLGISSLMDAPIWLFGKLEGVICHEHVGPLRRWTQDEQMFAIAMSNLISLAYEQWERKRAEEALQESRRALLDSQQELRALAAQLLTAQDDERRRVSRELHDDLNQKLAMLAFDTDALTQHLPDSPALMKERLQLLGTRLVTLSDDVRRIAYQLHPSILDHLGLAIAVQSYVDDFAKRERMPVSFTHTKVPKSLPQNVASCLYRVTQESLRNIAKHARARRASIALTGSSKGIHLSIKDSGMGFNPGTARVHGGGLGILSMQERVRLVNGEFSVQSCPGKGTEVSVQIPLPRSTT
jgi:PAS domain S-box-containing protein